MGKEGRVTIVLTPWFRVGPVSVALEFKRRDLWIGLYVAESYHEGAVTVRECWLCLLPMLPLHIVIETASALDGWRDA